MLQIQILPLGYLQTNCYIVEGTEGCVVIDPGDQPDLVLDCLGQRKLTAILLTHGHFDHVGAVRELAAETDCPVYLCAEDKALPSAMTAGSLYCTHSYAHGDCLDLSGLRFTVLHTPGHTPGSVCLCCEDAMFSGDTLFAGSIGRTDFPGSDPARMRDSLAQLKGLEKNYTVYPGHGEATTLNEEKRYNPFLR